MLAPLHGSANLETDANANRGAANVRTEHIAANDAHTLGIEAKAADMQAADIGLDTGAGAE